MQFKGDHVELTPAEMELLIIVGVSTNMLTDFIGSLDESQPMPSLFYISEANRAELLELQSYLPELGE